MSYTSSLPAASANMSLQSAGTLSSSSFLTIYGGIRTITYTTTRTISDFFPPEGVATLSWPSATTTEPVQYTILASLTNPASQYFPGFLPIYEVTETDEIIVNTAGQPITTIIEIQAQPIYISGATAVAGIETNCNDTFYKCWSTGEKAVFVLAVILAGLLVSIFVIWFYFRRIKKTPAVDEEQCHAMGRYSMRGDVSGGSSGRRQQIRPSDANKSPNKAVERTRGAKTSHRPRSLESVTEPPRPLPRIVGAEHYRDIRKVSRVPQHVLLSETSSNSSGWRAVVGVGAREPQKIRKVSPLMSANELRAANNPEAMSHTTGKISETVASSVIFKKRSDIYVAPPRKQGSARCQGNCCSERRGRSQERKRSPRHRHSKQNRSFTHCRSSLPSRIPQKSFEPGNSTKEAAEAALKLRSEDIRGSLYRKEQLRSQGRSLKPQHSQNRSDRKTFTAGEQNRTSFQHGQDHQGRDVQQESFLGGSQDMSLPGSTQSIPIISSKRKLPMFH